MKKNHYGFAAQEPKQDGLCAEAPENAEETLNTQRSPLENAEDECCPNCDATELAAQRAMAEAEEIRLRCLAEADNARKRFLREKDEAMRYAASTVLADIIPALDNLDLALEHGAGNPACKDFFVGVEMTSKLLMESLQKYGLSKVGKVGETFDPALHEALSVAPDETVPDGAICTLLNYGYKLHDRLLRPAKVIVCKK